MIHLLEVKCQLPVSDNKTALISNKPLAGKRVCKRVKRLSGAYGKSARNLGCDAGAGKVVKLKVKKSRLETLKL